MLAPLLITLREGLEAALILGIVMAYLARTGNGHRSLQIWTGAGVAILVSMIVAVGIFFTVAELGGTAEQIFEGSVMLLAVAMLTYMVVWMRHQSSGIKAGLHEKVETALRTGSGFSLALMAFIVVVREGIETALFFFASTRSSTPTESIAGGLLGLALAAVLGYSIYRGSHRLNLRTFFNVTGVLLIVFAAGMLAHGLHEYQEAGVLPGFVGHLWNTGWLLDDESGVGGFLAGLVGYSSDPSLAEVLAYLGYLGVSLTYFFRSAKRPRGITQPDARRVA